MKNKPSIDEMNAELKTWARHEREVWRQWGLGPDAERERRLLAKLRPEDRKLVEELIAAHPTLTVARAIRRTKLRQ